MFPFFHVILDPVCCVLLPLLRRGNQRKKLKEIATAATITPTIKRKVEDVQRKNRHHIKNGSFL